MAPPPSPPGPRHRLCNPPLTPSRRPTSRAHRQPHPASIAPNPPANEDGSALHSKPAFHPLPFTSVCSTTPPPAAAPMPSATPATPSPALSVTPSHRETQLTPAISPPGQRGSQRLIRTISPVHVPDSQQAVSAFQMSCKAVRQLVCLRSAPGPHHTTRPGLRT
jgi:hypothetical protein